MINKLFMDYKDLEKYRGGSAICFQEGLFWKTFATNEHGKGKNFENFLVLNLQFIVGLKIQGQSHICHTYRM